MGWSGLKTPKTLLLFTLPVVGVLYAAYLLTFDFVELLRFSVPPGQSVYLLSKLFGITAILLLGLQIFSGLLAKELQFDSFHRYLGIATLTSALVHVAAFQIAVCLRSDSCSLALLYPQFTSGYYPAVVSVGILSFYALLVVGWAGATGFVRRRSGKWIHRLAIIVFFAVCFHAWQIGTESRNGLLQFILGMECLAICAALVYRWHRKIILARNRIIE